VVESDTDNWILKPGHSRPMAASICSLECLRTADGIGLGLRPMARVGLRGVRCPRNPRKRRSRVVVWRQVLPAWSLRSPMK